MGNLDRSDRAIALEMTGMEKSMLGSRLFLPFPEQVEQNGNGFLSTSLRAYI